MPFVNISLARGKSVQLLLPKTLSVLVGADAWVRADVARDGSQGALMR